MVTRQWCEEIKIHLNDAETLMEKVVKSLYHRPGGKQFVYARKSLSEGRFWVGEGIKEFDKEGKP